MTEELWFILIAYIAFLIVGFRFKNQFFVALGGLLGLFMGFMCIGQVSAWLGIAFIFSSLYVIYHAMFRLGEK